MFKKQKPAEQPRSRQRTTAEVPQNTAVFSYHASRAVTLDPRGRQMTQPDEKPRRQRRKRLWLKPKNMLIACGVLIVFVYCISLSGKPKIVITGDSTSQVFIHDTSRYQQAAQSLFAQSLLNKNKLTINTDTIAHGLEAAYPEIRIATVTLPVIGQQPVVYIQPAVPQMVLATQHDGQFVLDSSGIALLPVSSRLTLPTGSKALPVVSDESGLSVKTGDIALPKQSVTFVAEVAGQLRAKQLTVSSWRLPAGTSELDVYISGVPYYVRFNLQGTAREEAGTYLATKNYLDAKHVTPGQYVDVRVSGRVYYK